MTPRKQLIKAVEEAGFVKSGMYLDICRYKKGVFAALEFYTITNRFTIKASFIAKHETYHKTFFVRLKKNIPNMIQKALDFLKEMADDK